MSNLLLLLHPMFGVLGILAAVWVVVDTLNATNITQGRIRTVSGLVALFIWLSYLIGGYWYVTSYAPDKAVILKGPWPFSHGFFMETKEHVFFILLLLATFLPVAARNDLASSKSARKFLVWMAGIVVVLGLLMESSGAFIGMGVKLGLMPK